jgi:hypothetical protein
LSLNESKWYDAESGFDDITKGKRTNRRKDIYDALDEELEALEEINFDYSGDFN